MPERITSHNGRVSHPVLLNRRTLMYLASDPDGSGPWLYSMDVERRIPHRLTFGPDRYTSLAADGRWQAPGCHTRKSEENPLAIADRRFTRRVVAPGSHLSDARYCVLSTAGARLSYIVSLRPAAAKAFGNGRTERTRSCGAAMERKSLAAPPSPPMADGLHFRSVKRSQTLLYVMQADGTNARVVADSLELQGSPAWTPDGRSITSAANDHGVPHLFQVRIDGGPATVFLRDYSDRSGMAALRSLRCLLGTRHRHDVFSEGRDARGCRASASAL